MRRRTFVAGTAAHVRGTDIVGSAAAVPGAVPRSLRLMHSPTEKAHRRASTLNFWDGAMHRKGQPIDPRCRDPTSAD